ncbi:MAG TPA: hypothetical protein VFW05_19520, partial [Verrucomicrobiae bacterium]|nr:hypothetical protein [Verrucomicrobiae bacterium]
PQRSAGRGLGRGDFELKTSSPRPSPPASLGGEGVISRFEFRKFNPLLGAGAKLRPQWFKPGFPSRHPEPLPAYFGEFEFDER